MAILINSMSDWLENKFLDWVFRNTNPPSYFIPARAYVSLYTADPTDDNTTALTNEVSGSGYARQQCYWYYSTGTGINYMLYQVDFPQTSGSWGTITDVGICSGSTSGSLLYHAKIYPNTGVSVNEGDIFSLLGGGINATVFGITGSAVLCTWVLQELFYDIINHAVPAANGLNIYARLYTTLPDFLGNNGVEVPSIINGVATGYIAPQIAGASKWTVPTSGSISNINTIDFFPTLAAQDIPLSVKGIALYYIYGNFTQIYMVLPFTEPLKINHWDGLKYLPGQFKIGVD